MVQRDKRDSKAGSAACNTPGCCEIDRRLFVKLSGASLAAFTAAEGPRAMAGPFSAVDTADHLVPADKKLRPEWIRELFARGTSTWYQGDDLKTIGMPVGGICAGQVYLTGDGRLVYWGIFNQQANSGYGRLNYQVGREPTAKVVNNREVVPAPEIDQGFAVRVVTDESTQVRTLDQSGFPSVRFCGEYPLGFVDFQAEQFPVQVQLEAFSPFVPLQAEDSALPATVLRYQLTNTSTKPVKASIAGWLQNGVLHHNRDQCSGNYLLVNKPVKGDKVQTMLLATRRVNQPSKSTPAPVVFADFEGGDYGDWKFEGDAFGQSPATGTWPKQQPVSGYRGSGLVNSFLGGTDQPQGKLISPDFTIERPYVSFLVGGGDSRETAIHLVVNGEVVKRAQGKRKEQLEPRNWNVSSWAGKKAHLEIVDQASGPWGHINVDQIEFRDTPMADQEIEARKLPDFGSMALSLIGATESTIAIASLPADMAAEKLFDLKQQRSNDSVERELDDRHRAALGTEATLQPGESATFSFVVSWYMPNLYYGKKLVRNHYAQRFRNAADVALYVAQHQERLADQTRLWHDTYYDSTLPHWLLDRLHSTVGNLATETCQWWENGRFWAYEGCGCCRGTCGHVWNYEHALARLFPSLERSVREMQDFAPGVGFIPETGEIRFRGEDWGIWAGDSQGGYVLKAYREHQISADSEFLKNNWPQIRKATEFLIAQDGDGDGLIEGKQHQTYDKDYYGPNTMVGSLYLGALRAAEEMAREMGEDEFAENCAKIFRSGNENSVRQLFNGEYFVQEVDSQQHPQWQYADGCLADQLFGQGWAHQVNLGYLYPVETVRKTLESIWKYCWAPDVGLQNARHEPERWFAFPGEAGLFTCTWPKSPHMGPESTRYRNEIWTGIEYQVANHMCYEGMLVEALAICRAIHDRYHPSKHNPFNEIECGDHYARALASWGVLLGLAGFEYHGPQKHLGFMPRGVDSSFRVAFTTSDGWGSYEERRGENRQRHSLDVKWGEVTLRTLALAVPEGKSVRKVNLNVASEQKAATFTQDKRRLLVKLGRQLVVPAGTSLVVTVEC